MYITHQVDCFKPRTFCVNLSKVRLYSFRCLRISQRMNLFSISSILYFLDFLVYKLEAQETLNKGRVSCLFSFYFLKFRRGNCCKSFFSVDH